MNVAQLNQYLSYGLVLLNVAFGAFVASVPDGHTLPWYVVAGVAALNAVVHALPTGSAPAQADVPPKAAA